MSFIGEYEQNYDFGTKFHEELPDPSSNLPSLSGLLLAI